ncbi:serine protein kinase RIO [Kribbia dieselivorans]|uniref:serine protein kinase RIO n=1 Tax=Kribbia dieselivorans TaxID=331526 RepID=UPI000AE499A7|nr:RIO1 family regulatory kinase/ATPase [Kribbia dieselivorans]
MSFNLLSDDPSDVPPEGERWSSWDHATHGPTPRPDWVNPDLGAVDEDLGILRSGKEADVHLVRRWTPGRPDEPVTMAAKRFRSSEHRLFHRDAGYLEGRRVRRSRETRAMARRTDFGRELIGAQWAMAEFATLSRLWEQGLAVPYPVQLRGTEILLEFITGPDGEAAPRLAQTRPPREMLPELFEQIRAFMLTLATLGWAHGDLSPYNVLLAGASSADLVVIDWPQVVDVIGNPHGPEFLERDARTMGEWFTRRGFEVDHGELFGDLMAAATSRW